MSQEIKIEIISPDKSIFSGKSEEVILPCFEGQVTILRDHIPIISFLKPGILKILQSSKNIKSFFVEEGIIEFYQNCLIVLSSKIIDTKDLKKDKVNQLISDAETKLKEDKLSDEERYLANHKSEVLRSLSLN